MLVDVMQYLGSIDSKPVYWFSSSHSEDLIPDVFVSHNVLSRDWNT